MKTIDRNQLESYLNEREDLALINVLSPEDFNREHIPGSVNVPQDDPDFEQKVEQIAGSKGRRIVVYCASESCNASSQAAKKLDKAGFTEVYDYEGGTADWAKAEQLQTCGSNA